MSLKSPRTPFALPPALIAAAAFLLFAAAPLSAEDEGQGSIDDLFNEPDSSAAQEDVPEEEDGKEGEKTEKSGEAPEERVDLDSLTTSPAELSGSVKAGVGAGAGLMEWPWTGAASGLSTAENLRFSGLYYTVVRLKADVRPEPYLRFHTTLKTKIDEQEMDFYSSIEELFIDYTLRETVFFRAGRQKLTWGQGRLLDNPADLVSRVEDGLCVRASLPFGSGTLEGLVYSREAWVGSYSPEDPRSFAYAGQWQGEAGPFTLGLLGHYKTGEPVKSAGTLSFGLGQVNAAADAVGYWDTGRPLQDSEWAAMGQLLWRSDGGDWTVLTEYQYDSQLGGGRGHRGALALKMPKLGGGGWRPLLRWRHAFHDDSGEVVPALSGSIAPDLTLSLGLPVIYGATGSFYRQALSEDDEEEETIGEEDYEVPLENVVSVLLSVGLSFTF